MELQAVSMPRRRELPITVRGPNGVDIKIPRWMTEPLARSIVQTDEATLAIRALHRVCELVAKHEDLISSASVEDHPPSENLSQDQEQDGGASTLRMDRMDDNG
jgi:hypothetical protein